MIDYLFYSGQVDRSIPEEDRAAERHLALVRQRRRRSPRRNSSHRSAVEVPSPPRVPSPPPASPAASTSAAAAAAAAAVPPSPASAPQPSMRRESSPSLQQEGEAEPQLPPSKTFYITSGVYIEMAMIIFCITLEGNYYICIHYFTDPRGANAHICINCGRGYRYLRGLQRHERQCRRGETFKCEICGVYETHRKDTLRRHRLVCLKRLTRNVFDDSNESWSNSSRVSDAAAVPVQRQDRAAAGGARVPPIIDIAPAPMNNRPRRDVNVRLSRNFPCDICGRPHGCMAELNEHRNVHNMPVDIMPTTMSSDFATLVLTKYAFGGHACEYDVVSREACSDVRQFFQMSADLIRNLIRTLSPAYLLQGRMVARVRFFQLNDAGEREEEVFLYFPSLPQSYVSAEDDGDSWYTSHSNRIIQVLDTVLHQSSNLEFDCIERVYLKFLLHDNADGQGRFALPPKLAKKRQAIVNVDADRECFKYALLSILHYNDVSEQQRSDPRSYREWEEELDFGDLDVNNITFSDIPKVERLNNLKINVHVWVHNKLTIRYNTRGSTAPKAVNVLLVACGALRHYCGIRSLSRLYSNKSQAHHVARFCERCCRKFSSWRNNCQQVKETLEEHYQQCVKGRLQREAVPEDTKYSYNTGSAEESPVAVCYSDIESYISPPKKEHCPYAIGMYTVWHEHFTRKREAATMRTWTGEKCLQNYLVYLDRFVRELDAEVQSLTNQPLILSHIEERAFARATRCAKCKAAFTCEGKRRKVRDHCHITGRFRGALCHVCNSRLRLSRRMLPVFFHNFKGYDSHLICKQAIGEMPDWHLSVIPVTHEKYMSLSVRVRVGEYVDRQGVRKSRFFRIVFLDSFQFLSSSLDALSATLADLPFTEACMRKRFPGISDAVIRRKGVFPYSYFNSPSRLEESCLPPIAAFRNDLSGAECSPEDYAHARRAWTELGCRTLRQYLVAYLHLDIYLLTDVFEAFRKLTMTEDGLDPVHFVSLPGLSYVACFKRSGETIDLLQDIDMVRHFERGIRGGLTFVNRHHVQARIPELGNNQGGNEWLAYIDQNNLYGSALCRPLPHSEFSWVADDVLARMAANPQEIIDIDDEADYGYLFEVDLEYPRELHADTSDFPLAPASDFIESDMFSPFMKEYYHDLCTARGSRDNYEPIRKLLLTQYDKEKYICHYSILKFYLGMGMRLVRVHSAIRFRQKRFVEPYIRYNSDKRALARNAFEKAFYKMKNNSFFGKTMEDVRHRIKYYLVTDWAALERYSSDPLFLDCDVFSERVTGVHMFQDKVVLNKPVYIGQAVLDYSKLEMYTLYYKILRQCPLIRKAELVGGDTDSFFLSLHTDRQVRLEDVFRDLSAYFDSSNYPQNHPLYSTANTARLGCFKDEAAGKLIEEMVLLRPKMYSMKYLGDRDGGIKRAKGISRHLVASTSHATYREAFVNQMETGYEMTILRSELHTVRTVTFRKRGLSAWEDKRCWLEPNASVPHGSHLSGLPPKRRRVFVPPPSGDVVD